MISTYIIGEELFTRGSHFEFGAERRARSKVPDGRLARQKRENTSQESSQVKDENRTPHLQASLGKFKFCSEIMLSLFLLRHILFNSEATSSSSTLTAKDIFLLLKNKITVSLTCFTRKQGQMSH